MVPFDRDFVWSVRTHARDVAELILQQKLQHPGELVDAPWPAEFCNHSHGGAPSFVVDEVTSSDATHENKSVQAGQQASF
jgi:hypothetical protein